MLCLLKAHFLVHNSHLAVFTWQKGQKSFLGSHFFFLSMCVWSIIALQRSVSFCCTTRQTSYLYTYIPSTWASHLTHLGHHRALSWVPHATGVSSLRPRIPLTRALLSWLITSQRPHLLIPSPQGWGFNLWTLRGHIQANPQDLRTWP